ncbi:MAG: lactate utilization protein B [Bdellovibrionota bacterium]
MSDHAEKAAAFTADEPRTHWHDKALWYVREKRDRAAGLVPDWERLRDHAAQIKLHTISHLEDYLQEFEKQATARGAHVHWARDAEEHNRIVLGILEKRNAKRIVKSKSMLTEECGLNHFLEERGIQVTDTDLGEWIVQLRKEPPSHIVMPAIHIKKEEIGELLQKTIGTEPGNSDPKYLTEASRIFLRKRYLEADASLSGVNFAIAESGAIVVCTNEGNADLGTSVTDLHIACVGIEKLLPKHRDLGVFLRLLARSATGQPITTYSSHFLGPKPGGELHIVLVDNGRTKLLLAENFRRSLSCIRCGACMNTCPVYRRSGGYSYSYTVPGPIGSVLAPHRDKTEHGSLPFASTLCGSCSDVCPVKINLHEQLLMWRAEIPLPLKKRAIFKATKIVLERPGLYAAAGKIGRRLLTILPRNLLYSRLNIWGRNRELPIAPQKSFREQYREGRRGK